MKINNRSQNRLSKLYSKSLVFPLIKSVMITIKCYKLLHFIVAIAREGNDEGPIFIKIGWDYSHMVIGALGVGTQDF